MENSQGNGGSSKPTIDPHWVDFLLQDIRLKCEILKAQFDSLSARFRYFITLQSVLLLAFFTAHFNFAPQRPPWQATVFAAVFALLLCALWFVIASRDWLVCDELRLRISKAQDALVEYLKDGKKVPTDFPGKRGESGWRRSLEVIRKFQFSVVVIQAFVPIVFGIAWVFALVLVS